MLAKLLCPWNFLGTNTGAGCHFLLQGIFLTKGLNPHLLRLMYWQVDSLWLSHQETASFALMKNASARTSQVTISWDPGQFPGGTVTPPFLGEALGAAQRGHVLRPGRIQSILHPNVENSFVAVVGDKTQLGRLWVLATHLYDHWGRSK